MIFFSYVLMTLLGFAGLFLIGLILLQRGRGGGLAGALSGMGGQSFAGTRAGDVFTRITIGVAAAWILLCAGSVVALHNSTGGQRATGFPTKDEIKAEQDKAEAAVKASREKAGAADNDADLKLDFDTTKPAGESEQKKADENKAEDKKVPESNSSPAGETQNEEPKTDGDKKPE